MNEDSNLKFAQDEGEPTIDELLESVEEILDELNNFDMEENDE